MTKKIVDAVPPASGREYKVTTLKNGNSKIEDVTQYEQEGSTFGAKEVLENCVITCDCELIEETVGNKTREIVNVKTPNQNAKILKFSPTANVFPEKIPSLQDFRINNVSKKIIPCSGAKLALRKGFMAFGVVSGDKFFVLSSVDSSLYNQNDQRSYNILFGQNQQKFISPSSQIEDGDQIFTKNSANWLKPFFIGIDAGLWRGNQNYSAAKPLGIIRGLNSADIESLQGVEFSSLPDATINESFMKKIRQEIARTGYAPNAYARIANAVTDLDSYKKALRWCWGTRTTDVNFDNTFGDFEGASSGVVMSLSYVTGSALVFSGVFADLATGKRYNVTYTAPIRGASSDAKISFTEKNINKEE